MKSREFFQVDAFADEPFSGNPAAVFVLEKPALEKWMQLVAREMNLAETAFLVPIDQNNQQDNFSLRWFTPAVEVDLCGHATLASAHVLYQTRQITSSRFQTRSGELRAKVADGLIQLDFPATPNTQPTGDDLATLQKVLFDSFHHRGEGVKPVAIRRYKFDVLVEVDSEATVRNLHANIATLKNCEVARGVIVTSRADKDANGGSKFDFVSRFFAPRAGVDEDPVTGSAHCALTPYWSEKLGKTQMLAYQASTRGGVVRVTLQGDRVLLAGQAITIFKGQMMVE